MRFKGINYNAGIDYSQCNEGQEINIQEFLNDLKWIKKMNCNSIRLYGSYNKKLLIYSKLALKKKFIVWASPRYIGKTREETLKLLLHFSRKLEKLRKEENLFLVIGNEFSIDMKGLVPGNTQLQRARNYAKAKKGMLVSIFKDFMPKIRKVFKGKITYAALPTEEIDYGIFDYIGINYYWHFLNMVGYTNNLIELSEKYKKKIIITEFGTCGYRFASLLNGAAFYPVQELRMHEKPFLKRLIIPDEKEQVRCLKRCFRSFEKANVEGTFIFDYAEKWKIYDKDKRNMDLASFGIMKAYKNGTVKPKAAFHYIKKHYA